MIEDVTPHVIINKIIVKLSNAFKFLLTIESTSVMVPFKGSG